MTSPKHKTSRKDGCSSGDNRTLIIVPCGARKVWHTNPHAGACPAREAYTSQLFKAYRDYAQAFSTEWRIVSAKYGIVHPDQRIENYDCKFDASYLAPKNWWRLEGMVLQAHALPICDRLILLGGNLYRSIMRKVFLGIYRPCEIIEPFAGCDLPTTIRKMRVAVAKNRKSRDFQHWYVAESIRFKSPTSEKWKTIQKQILSLN